MIEGSLNVFMWQLSQSKNNKYSILLTIYLTG